MRRRDVERAALKMRLAGLTAIVDPHSRGLALERVLHDIFKIDGLSANGAFTIKDETGQVQEQVDGLVVVDGNPLLVEAKWHAAPIGTREISRHLVRVYGRAGVMGLFVSWSPYTKPAVRECRNMLSQRVIVLAEVREILALLDDPGASFAVWLRAKITAASANREPLFYPHLRQRSA